MPFTLRSSRLSLSALALGISGIVAGCGGTSPTLTAPSLSNTTNGSSAATGGSSSGGAATRAATVSLYVTDGFRDDWSQVLVTLFKIEASSDNGATYTPLYESADGQTVDLTSLAQTAQLLSSVAVPAKDITNVRVTLGDSITVTPTTGGGASQTLPVDSKLPNVSVADGKASVTLAARTPIAAGKLSNLIVDFKLAAFELVSGHIRPSLVPGDADEFKAKQKVAHLSGSVSTLTAGTGFDLITTPRGANAAGVQATVHVNVTGDTTITGPGGRDNKGGTTVTLADGQQVRVEGTADPATGVVDATEIHVLGTAPDPGKPDTASKTVVAIGKVATIGADAGTFALSVREIEHFRPERGSIDVQTNAATSFLQGKTASTFAAVTAGSPVLVVGSVDPATKTLVAQTILLLPAPTGK